MKKVLFGVIVFVLMHSHLCFSQVPKLLFQKEILETGETKIFPDGQFIEISNNEAKISHWQKKENIPILLSSQKRLVISENGLSWGMVNYNPKAPELVAESFVLFNSDGTKKYEITSPEANFFFISTDEKTVVGMLAFEGQVNSKILFYNETGAKIKELDIPNFQGITFSPNGQWVAVNSAKDGILVFDSKGEKVWEMGKGEKVCFSLDGKIVALESSGNIKIFSEQREKANLNLGNSLLRILVLSSDGKYILAGDKKNLFLIDVATGKTTWEYKLPQPELNLISADISNNAKYIILGLDFDSGREVSPQQRHSKGYVYLLNQTGKKVWEKELSYKSWNVFVPEVKINSLGDRFSVRTRGEVLVYSVE
jgi:WD40 repeat protein